MGNLTDYLADRFFTHAVDLARFEAGERRRVLRLLKTLEADLVKEIAATDPSGPTRTAWQQRRLEALLDQTRQTIAKAYRQMDRTHSREMGELAGIEAEWAAESVNDQLGATVMSVSVPDALLREISRNTLIDGNPASEWWQQQAQSLQRAVAGELRQGMLRGETMNELARRIRGRRENGYADGLVAGDTKKARRDALALVQTSVQSVSSAARTAVYEANDDVLRGTQHLSTLDFRTCPICQPLDNAAWDFNGKPLPDSPYQGPDPKLGSPSKIMHWRCRCTRVPVLKSYDEILGTPEVNGRKKAAVERISKSTRASMDGQVAEEMTYEQWLAKKSEAQQKAVLGPGKWELWRSGKLSFEDMIDQSGRPLTLRELRGNAR